MSLKQVQLIIVLILTAGPVFSGSPDRSAVDAIFSDYDTTVSPGCSLAVFRDGEIDYTRGYGMANLEYGIANASDTVFRIASTSKQFTAMAMALLAEQGKISLDDDIHKFFPSMPDYGEPVTIRQLIHHSSGIRDYLTLTYLADWGENYTVDEVLRMISRQQELNFPPNTDYLYSNSGYFLISQIVELVTGQSLSEWADENMFRPLAMTSTHFHDDHNHIVPNRADGYDDADAGGFEISMTTLDMVGDGGIYTTVEDMLKWDRNFYDNKLGKGGPALIELVETPGRFKDGTAMDYAFGLGIGEFEGTREVSHGGAFVGFRAGYNRYSQHHLSVVVFCNYANTRPTGLARQVASLYLDNAQTGSNNKTEKVTGDTTHTVEVSNAALERVTGEYLDPATFSVRSIVLEKGELFYDRGGENRSKLEPLGDNLFLMTGVPVKVQVSFDVGAKLMTVAVEGQEPSRLEKFKRSTPASAELAAYAGSYYSKELDYTQVLTVRDSAIDLVRRTGPETLKPLTQDVLVSEEGVALVFSRNGEGAVTGFVVQAGRVRNIGYVRQ
jgi:CubicO group peptidase (beta-lactamase class C family)